MFRKRLIIYLIVDLFALMSLTAFVKYEGKEANDWAFALFFLIILILFSLLIINEFYKIKKKLRVFDNVEFVREDNLNNISENNENIKSNNNKNTIYFYDTELDNLIKLLEIHSEDMNKNLSEDYRFSTTSDDLLTEALEIVIKEQKASTSLFQRRLVIGYNRAARLIDSLEELGIIGGMNGSKPRTVNIYFDELLGLVTKPDFENYGKLDNNFKYYPENNYLEDDLDNLTDGLAFEQYISNLLNKLGYQANVTQASNDYGVDVIASKNQVGYAIQCKYYSSTVGNSAVQEIVSGMKHYNAHVGIVVTNNYFTKNAIELARTNNIILWDRDILLKMIKKTQ